MENVRGLKEKYGRRIGGLKGRIKACF